MSPWKWKRKTLGCSMNSCSSLTFHTRFIRRLPRLHKCLFGMFVFEWLIHCSLLLFYVYVKTYFYISIYLISWCFRCNIKSQWILYFIGMQIKDEILVINYHQLFIVRLNLNKYHLYPPIEELKRLVNKMIWIIFQTNKFKWRHI